MLPAFTVVYTLRPINSIAIGLCNKFNPLVVIRDFYPEVSIIDSYTIDS